MFFNLSSNNPCLLCDTPTSENTLVCKDCFVDFPQIKNACYQCALPLHQYAESSQKTQICGNCLNQPPSFDYTLAAFLYAQPLDYLIRQFKFSAQLVTGHALAKLMLKVIDTDVTGTPESIIPVPLHRNKLKSRGYNQAQELAHPIAKSLNINADLITCARIKDTQAQSGLTKKERIKNVKNAFELNRSISAEHVILLDDIMTTGNTLNELAKQLKKAGVKTVGIWVCARAVID